MKILLSIRPEFAEKILNGTKKYEFRKKGFKRTDVKKILIYATKPVGKIVGEFDIAEIIEDVPSRLWSKTHQDAGIDRLYFDGYFASSPTGVAIKVENPLRYEQPFDLDEVVSSSYAPQSFRYV